MKILVSGSRTFSNSKVFMDIMTDVIAELQYRHEIPLYKVELIHGSAKGTDSMADMFARGNKIKLKVFPADWDAYGKSAGMKRNLEMLYYTMSDPTPFLVAFNVNNSKGTSMMIESCKKKDIPAYIFTTDGGENFKLECFKVESILKEKYK